jgi:hypothetical protein
MRCDKCGNEAVFFQSYSGRHLCSRHLALDIEARAKRTIRSHHWMSHGDHIAVVVTGDRKSAALLSFLQKLTADRRDIRLSAIPACGEDAGTKSRSSARTVAESLRVPCIEMPLPTGSGTAAQEKVTRIALAISLDDIAQEVLGEFLFGNAGRLVHPWPGGNGPVPVICPFITVPSDELDIYGDFPGNGIDLEQSTLHQKGVQKDTAAFLDEYSRRHTATKFALLHLWEQMGNGNAAALHFPDTDGTGSREEMPGTSRFCGGVTRRGS